MSKEMDRLVKESGRLLEEANGIPVFVELTKAQYSEVRRLNFSYEGHKMIPKRIVSHLSDERSGMIDTKYLLELIKIKNPDNKDA